MGKKDKEEMTRQKSRFIDGAKANDVDPRLAGEIFELVNEFAGYGFNKSHAAAYALVSFRTAYLKAHYPCEFLAATMSLDLANTEKLAQFYQEARRLGLEVVKPDVNVSFADFEVRGERILYALGALKNVGPAAMEHVVAVRGAGGPFKDLFDFARRVDTRIVNKRALENLARAGAFDSLEPNRARAFEAAAKLQSIGNRAAEERASAQVNLFGEETSAMAEPELADTAPWDAIRALDEELAAVGFYLSGHPLDGYMDQLEGTHIRASHIDAAYSAGKRTVKIAGVLTKRQERISQRSNKRYAFLEMSDPTGNFESMVNAELLGAQRDLMQVGALLELSVKLEERDGEIKLYTNSVAPLGGSPAQTSGTVSKPKDAAPRSMTVFLRSADALSALQRRMESLSDAPALVFGQVKVVIPMDEQREAEIALSKRYSMDKGFYAALMSVPGVDRIERA